MTAGPWGDLYARRSRGRRGDQRIDRHNDRVPWGVLPLTRKQVRLQMEAQKGRCWYCEEPFAQLDLPEIRKKMKTRRERKNHAHQERWFHIEHRTPVSRGGTNGPTNIVLACPPCNLRKGTLTEDEFQNLLRAPARAQHGIRAIRRRKGARGGMLETLLRKQSRSPDSSEVAEPGPLGEAGGPSAHRTI